MRNLQTGNIFTEHTDEQGLACFRVTPGIYEASTSLTRETADYTYFYNGSRGQIAVLKGDNAPIALKLQTSRISKRGGIIIKEVYNGGCPMDNGSEFFQMDKCIVLYNNSPHPASLDNLAFGFATPYNSNARNANYDKAGHLVYEAEGFTPALNGIWYFPQTLTMQPYQQVVVCVHGAIDNTLTYSQSVNYAHEDYYCMYDPESGYMNTAYYPTPADVIPTSHYLKAVKYGQGNAWPLSSSSPALFLFQTKDTTPALYANNPDNLWYSPDAPQTPIYACLKVPNEWIIDGVEVFTTATNDNQKRLTADIDAGYVSLTNKLGHSLYRNVDTESTLLLPDNEGKIVWGYTLRTDGNTDSDAIDAEASIKNGARIVFMDTNNSTADFHERTQCSLTASFAAFGLNDK
jgi:hypothetical protein